MSQINDSLMFGSPLAASASLLSPLDAAIVILFLAASLCFGLWMGAGQRSTVDYFLGGRSLPSWAVLLSIVATETSTVTFLSIPGITFASQGDFRFLQVTFGYVVGRLLVVWLLLPLYFKGEPFTSYEVLENRFGKQSRRLTSVLFLATRNLSDALRLYLTALALREATGVGLTASILSLGVVTIAYTYFGGVRSVIWNDCIQFTFYMVGALSAAWLICQRLPGGAEQVWDCAAESGKWRLLDFDPSLTKPTITFWSGLIGGTFLTLATHGTDQLTIQRCLAARDRRGASWAMAASGLVVLLQFALFLAIGAALACFYETFPTAEPLTDQDKDRAFAYFIVNDMGRGIAGFTLAAVFAAAMSTLSSSLNSSATTLVNDVYVPMRREPVDRAGQLSIGRWATAAFGVLQVVLALASHQLGVDRSIVWQVLAIAGFATGPVLGIYLLATLAPSVEQTAALSGFCVGLLTLTTIAYSTQVNAFWYAVMGASTTFVSGWSVQRLIYGRRTP